MILGKRQQTASLYTLEERGTTDLELTAAQMEQVLAELKKKMEKGQ